MGQRSDSVTKSYRAKWAQRSPFSTLHFCCHPSPNSAKSLLSAVGAFFGLLLFPSLPQSVSGKQPVLSPVTSIARPHKRHSTVGQLLVFGAASINEKHRTLCCRHSWSSESCLTTKMKVWMIFWCAWCCSIFRRKNSSKGTKGIQIAACSVLLLVIKKITVSPQSAVIETNQRKGNKWQDPHCALINVKVALYLTRKMWGSFPKEKCQEKITISQSCQKVKETNMSTTSQLNTSSGLPAFAAPVALTETRHWSPSAFGHGSPFKDSSSKPLKLYTVYPLYTPILHCWPCTHLVVLSLKTKKAGEFSAPLLSFSAPPREAERPAQRWGHWWHPTPPRSSVQPWSQLFAQNTQTQSLSQSLTDRIRVLLASRFLEKTPQASRSSFFIYHHLRRPKAVVPSVCVFAQFYLHLATERVAMSKWKYKNRTRINTYVTYRSIQNKST